MPAQHTRDWIDYLVAFAPLVAISVAVSVALMQAYLQRQHLKQTLYDKRWEIRQGLQEFYENTLTAYPKADSSAHLAMSRLFAHAEDLYGSDALSYIRQYCTLIGQMLAKNHEILAHLDSHDFVDSPELHKEYGELSEAFTSLVHKQKEVFRPYLQLHHDQSWFARFATRVNRWVNQEVPAELKSRYPS